MSQRDYLRAMDSTIAGAFAGVGMIDSACWRSKDGSKSADNVRALVDRNVDLIGTDGGVVTNQTVIWLYIADLGQAAGEGDEITVDGVRYIVSKTIGRDESAVQLSVKEAR